MHLREELSTLELILARSLLSLPFLLLLAIFDLIDMALLEPVVHGYTCAPLVLLAHCFPRFQVVLNLSLAGCAFVASLLLGELALVS